MAKTKSIFFCQNCGNESTKWVGKCPACGEWNTYVEEVVSKTQSRDKSIPSMSTRKDNKPQRIQDIQKGSESRVNTRNNELNRVLGGGLVPGSIILIGGEPGIGKSTLLLQVALNMKDTKILYVTGEESDQQIKMRAERIGIHNNSCFLLTETSTQQVFRHIENVQPDVLVIDSIQTLHTDSIESSAGSLSQIRECAAELQRFSKVSGVPVFLIGHITKEGSLAGPKILEHMVDTVLQFEGDRNHEYRILRSMKNRFGSTSELGIYEMRGSGLREVDNPSEVLLSKREENVSGVAVAATIEGMRPMLIEVQALVSSAAYGTPQRSTTGFDLRRMNMLLAVLEKRSGFRLAVKDVFLNITGGLKVDDPAVDLAVVAAVLSSSEDISVDQKICLAAEVGLSGEIRPVNRIEQRISEAQKLGFQEIFISKFNQKGLDSSKLKINIVPVSKISELYGILFK